MTTVFVAIETNGMTYIPTGVFESLDQAKTTLVAYGYTSWRETTDLMQPAVTASNDDTPILSAAIITHEVGQVFEMSKLDRDSNGQDVDEFLKDLLGD